MGSVWFENLLWYEGDHWSQPAMCVHSDNLLDNSPALVPLPSGKVLLIGSSDGRRASMRKVPQRLAGGGARPGRTASPHPWPDPVNNELVLAEFGPRDGNAAPPRLSASPADGKMRPGRE